jgi:hypothetical protein
VTVIVSLGAGASWTWTMTVALALPPGPLQLKLNADCAESGVVISSPVKAFLPFQPPDAAQSLASCVVQLSFATAPVATVPGVAFRVTVGSG